jgi:hypothetical protein
MHLTTPVCFYSGLFSSLGFNSCAEERCPYPKKPFRIEEGELGEGFLGDAAQLGDLGEDVEEIGGLVNTAGDIVRQNAGRVGFDKEAVRVPRPSWLMPKSVTELMA